MFVKGAKGVFPTKTITSIEHKVQLVLLLATTPRSVDKFHIETSLAPMDKFVYNT